MEKRILSLFLLICLILSLFSACGEPAANVADDTIPTEPVDLTIVTERNVDSGANTAMDEIIKQFKVDYPNVTIHVEYLPKNEDEREVVLTNYRTAILAGDGPDIFLFPDRTLKETIINHNQKITCLEMLFNDVQIAMRNGCFTDISIYYDQDEALNKSELNQAVMDAGLWGDARYVLPLRYNMRVYIAATERLAEAGLDAETLAGLSMQDVLDQGQQSDIYAHISPGCNVIPDGYWSCIFPDALNYEKDKVELQTIELVNFWVDCKSAFMLDAERATSLTNPASYGKYKITSLTGTYPVESTTLMTAYFTSLVDSRLDIPVTVVPQRAMDRTTTAYVTYYGAVGSGCDTPRLAYELLRRFLLPEYQFATNYKVKNKYGAEYFIGDSDWPVRTEGSVEALNNEGITEFPILDQPIDNVGFEFGDCYSYYLDYVQPPEGEDVLLQENYWLGEPTEVCTEIIRRLRNQLSES